MPILILEGSNKSGKTTLIHAIEDYCKEKSIDYVVMNRRVANNSENVVTPEDMFKVAMDDLCEAAKEHIDGKLVIFDRFHISEYVYGKIFRGYTNNYMYKIEQILSVLGANVVFVYSEYDHIHDCFVKWKLQKIQYDFVNYFDRVSNACHTMTVSLKKADKKELESKAEEIVSRVL